MKIKLFLLLILLLSFGKNSQCAPEAEWNVSKSTHFIIHYKSAPQGFIDELSSRAEDYYNRIADDLGFRRFEFWLWDNRARIYIYDDARDYQSSTGQPAWSGGCAAISSKVIYTFPYAKGFFDTTLPHEMGHIIFREFVGFNNPAVPSWLDEGVASFQERMKFETADQVVRDAQAQGSFVPLERLSSVSPYFLQTTQAVQVFYSEGISLVRYLIRQFGSDSFVSFCQRLRDKRNLEEAIRMTYNFNSVAELEKAWLKYLKNE